MRANRRSLTLAALVAAALAVGFALFGASDQRKIVGLLRELVAAPNTSRGDSELERRRRVESALARLTLPSVTLQTPELGSVEGRAAVLELLRDAEGVSFENSIEQFNVRIGATTASATLLVSISARTLGLEIRQKRTANVSLVKRGSGFFVAAIQLGNASHDQPEPRP